MHQYDNADYPFCCKCIKKRPQFEPTELLKEKLQEYCRCIKPSEPKNARYCSHCQFKLRKTFKNQNGIAYTLTLESDSYRRQTSKKRRKKELEEIRVRIPCPYNRKGYKDQENRKVKVHPETITTYIDNTNNDLNIINKTDNSINEKKKSESVMDNGPLQIVKRNLTLQV